MTAEHITLVEPTDLRAIRIVCKKCRCTLTIQLDETIRIPSDCPVCKERWWLEQQFTGKYSPPETLAAALKIWRSERDNHPFTLQFEVTTTNEGPGQKRN
jgi:hypothetical protein